MVPAHCVVTQMHPNVRYIVRCAKIYVLIFREEELGVLSRYKDIGELMKRCETLVATRDNLLSTRDKIRTAIQKEEESLAQFKEEQNARILDLSAKLNEMQERY